MRNFLELKPNLILLVLLFVLFCQGQPVWAATCTTAPECVQTGTQAWIGAYDSLILPITANPSDFDTTRFTSTTGFELWVADDIKGLTLSNSPYALVEKMYFGDSLNAGNTPRMDVTFFSSILTADRQIKDTGTARSLETSQLNLKNVNFETKPTLHFFGTDNQINLIDSRVYFRTTPLFISNAPLTINVNDPSGTGTDSSFFNFFGNMRPQQTTINIANGNTLTFENSGSLSPFASDSQKLNFSSPVTGNVDNATLKFRYSNVYFNSADFNFTNNATLDVFGSDTKVEFEKLSLATGSKMVLSNNTTVTASELRLNNATIDLESGAKVNADAIWVDGPATLDGPGGNGAGINTEGFVLSAGTTFTQNSSKVAVSDFFLLRSGAVLDITDGEFSAKTIDGQGGTVNINTGGEFVIAGGFSTQKTATFTIDAASFLRVAPIAELTLVPSLFVLNDGQLTVDGFLSGNGTILGNGLLNVAESGQIAPGNPRANKIGTITFENAVNFDNFVSRGNPTNQNQYWADIDVVGGVPVSDLLQYDDNDFNITGLSSIKVNTASAKTADELDRKSFTIISSVDAGSTGTLTTGGSYPVIVEGGDIPALIDFTVSDSPTVVNADVTLLAEKDSDHLAKHPSVTSRNHRSGVSLLINAVNSGNAATMSALNSLTNRQVESHLDSFHPETYSSYMTISLEHSDMVMNTVLNHAASSGHVSTGRTGEAEEQQTGKHFWMEASYNEGEVNGDGDLGDFDYNLSSLTVGQDLVASDDRALGIYFSFGTQEMDEHDKAIQDFDGDVYHLGMYLNQANVGGWDLRGVLGYAYGDHSSKRRVSLGNTSETTSADYDSHSTYVGVKGTVTGYQNDWVTLSPELGFNYIYYTQESFKESGDPALSLKVDSADAQAIIASAGLNARFASFSDTMSIYPLAFARYEHDFYANANNEHEIDAALVAHPDYKQTFVGQNRGEHALITGLGLGSNITSALQVNGGFVHSENSHGSEWGAGMNLEYLW